MAGNEFEKVDSVQPDALTLQLIAQDGMQYVRILCPASATAGRLPRDYDSGPMQGKEGFRAAIKLANDLKVPIVVLDEQDLWPKEWGTLVVPDGDSGPQAA